MWMTTMNAKIVDANVMVNTYITVPLNSVMVSYSLLIITTNNTSVQLQNYLQIILLYLHIFIQCVVHKHLNGYRFARGAV